MKLKATLGRWGSRIYVQTLGVLAFNNYFFSSLGKRTCIPVLNCYSCPIGAVACPIGTITGFALLQRIPYYVIGTLGLAGAALGRAFCGWGCPFGFLQDLMYRIPSPKWKLPRAFGGLKYVLLVVLVIGLPLFLEGGKMKGAGDRITGEAPGAYDYCALVCPAGTLEASVPMLISDPELRAQAAWSTWRKFGILGAVLVLMVFFRRSFCRALCPLGAIMAVFSRFSLSRLETDPGACIRCMKCVRVCPTASRMVPEEKGGKESSIECVFCLDCVRSCPEAGALSARVAGVATAVSKGRDNG
jgi:polyferredoxin